MLNCSKRFFGIQLIAVTSIVVVGLISSRVAVGQNNNNNNGTTYFPSVNVVGGVSISVDGILKNLDANQRGALREARQKSIQPVPGDLNQSAKLRKVSLRKLEDQIHECQEAGRPIPDAIKYLAGLQRVQFLFIYPEEHDIVIAGPAEGWLVNREGQVVGNTTGRPVLHLDDLLVALRFADAARKEGMTASIDPTEEGIQRLNALLSQLTSIGSDPQQTMAAIEDALGPQKISIAGIPTDSRFANVLVAADYRMKRLGMGFDESPVKGMPSYLQLAGPAAGKNRNMMPRWWLAPKYDPLQTDGDGLAFEICGSGVQCMAEEDHFNEMGQRKQRLKANPASQKWADTMTKLYDELAARETVFGDLRNCIDLAVIGALIVQENLLDKANLPLKLLFDEKRVVLDKYNSPTQVPTQASCIKKGKNWIISASGGVAFQPWFIVEKQVKSSEIMPVRATVAKARNDRWWWN